jgi:hypothetical protein
MPYILQIAGVEQLVADIIAFLPRLAGAVVILLLGWLIGVALARVVSTVADRIELDRAVLKTPLGGILGGTEKAVSKAFGTVTKWFVVAVAILAAADVLDIALLSEWIAVAVSYLPAFVAGLLIIVVGFVVADFIGDTIMRTEASTDVPYTGAFATGVKLFLYFTVTVIGLSTMGVDVSILDTFAQAFAWGLAAAVALGVGIALGWGGKDYVASNIGRWMGTARESTVGRRTGTSGASATADGGRVMEQSGRDEEMEFDPFL